ncbi:ParA family protein [Rhodobacteraceae bacterium NNCM2]|nr:ParA family protein [Coraliihabitans acroporae]
MAKTVLFAQQKGGAGKTTLLTQIATFLAGEGNSVTLIDLDPQRTLSSWYDKRLQKRGDGGGLELTETSEWRAASDIAKAGKTADFVFVDAPGNADILGRIAMREADFAVIPCQPSMPDVWASEVTLAMLAKAGCAHALVLNRCPPRGKAADQAAEALAETGAPILEARVGQRAAFTDAFVRGSGVSETAKTSKAAEEISGVAAAIIAQLG